MNAEVMRINKTPFVEGVNDTVMKDFFRNGRRVFAKVLGNIAKRRLYTRLVYAFFLLPGRQFVVYALYFALYCASAYIFVYSTVLVFLTCYIGLYGLMLFYKRRNRGSLSVITGVVPLI